MQQPNKLRVAVAQIRTSLGDLRANLAKHLDVIEQARTRSVDLLMFPELSLTGYIPSEDTLSCAIRRSDPLVQEIADASGEMFTVFGCIEEGPGAQFHNAAFTVRNGKLIFLHHKLNLPNYGRLEESKYFAAGRYLETFDIVRPWRGSILICADIWNPALVHLAAVHGSTVLLTPISSAEEAVGAEFDNPEGWTRCLSFYAMIYGMPIMVANRVGLEGGLHFWGGSRILGPKGDVLAMSETADEELLDVEFDYRELREARFRLPTVRDSNLDLILRETERLVQTVGVPPSVRRDL